MTDLLFQFPTGQTDLVFGDKPSSVIADIVSDFLPNIPTIVGVFDVALSLDLIDSAGCEIEISEQQAQLTNCESSVNSAETDKTQTIVLDKFAECLPIDYSLHIVQTDTDKIGIESRFNHQQADKIEKFSLVKASDTIKIKPSASERSQQAIRVDTISSVGHAEAYRDRQSHGIKQTETMQIKTGLHIDHHHGRLVDVNIRANWQQGIAPPSGYWQGVLPPGPPIPVPDNGEKAHLLFSKQSGVDLLFGHLTAGEALADREAYIVANTFEMKRASDNEPIECRDFNASIDVDSWSWSWSASIAASQQSLVEPADGDPVEVLVTVNGFVLRLVCERMSRARKFPDTWLSINGRGRSAWLADPYDFARTYDNDAGTLTANQLADEAMKENGVSIGWTVDWGIEDWSVPAGVWHFQGTHIDAVNRIAEAAGAYVQADQSTKTLHILPRYPAMPVDWDELVGDVELPEDICETESIEWVDKADYNAVWVAGGADGRLDKVKKTGSAGDRPAQTVTDDLMTATQATRQRGIRVLADTGRKSMVTLRLPVIDEVGVVMVGDVVDYTQQGVAKRGINRSTSLQYNYPQLWQTIKVETHG